MSDLYNWLCPIRNITSDGRTAIPSLMATIQEYVCLLSRLSPLPPPPSPLLFSFLVTRLVPQISSTKPNKIIAPILTSLRLLLTFVLPPRQQQQGLYIVHQIDLDSKNRTFFFFYRTEGVKMAGEYYSLVFNCRHGNATDTASENIRFVPTTLEPETDYSCCP